MAMSMKELRKWLAAQSDDDTVFIGIAGLALHAATSGAYLEVGGEPDPDEDEILDVLINDFAFAKPEPDPAGRIRVTNHYRCRQCDRQWLVRSCADGTVKDACPRCDSPTSPHHSIQQ